MKTAQTPLHLAALRGSVEAVTALAEAGADTKARDTNGKLPVDYAADNEQLKGTDFRLRVRCFRSGERAKMEI